MPPKSRKAPKDPLYDSSNSESNNNESNTAKLNKPKKNYGATNKTASASSKTSASPKPLCNAGTSNDSGKVQAVANFIPECNNGVRGKVVFLPMEDGNTEIIGLIEHIKPGKHGFHIHTYGDLSKGCDSACAHYNPHQGMHGAPTDKKLLRHAGDLGNITANANGKAFFRIIDPLVKLSGPYSVIGRSLVIHEDPDDLGKTRHPFSKTTGNSGKRIACAVIGIKNPST